MFRLYNIQEKIWQICNFMTIRQLMMQLIFANLTIT